MLCAIIHGSDSRTCYWYETVLHLQMLKSQELRHSLNELFFQSKMKLYNMRELFCVVDPVEDSVWSNFSPDQYYAEANL